MPAIMPDRNRPRMSRRLIISTAQAIAEKQGVDAVTMRRVAEGLRITPMALYRHIADKDDLLRALLDRSHVDMPPPGLPVDPRVRLLALVRWHHASLARHPWAISLAATGELFPQVGACSLQHFDRAFRDSGLDHREAAQSLRVLWRFLIGDLTQRARRPGAAGRAQESFEEDLDRIIDALLPRPGR
jgi:AcrR family transcriptional regulator